MDRTKLVSKVFFSTDFTANVAAVKDDRQRNPSIGALTLPDLPTRKLRAKLLFEETLETIKGLGLDPMFSFRGVNHFVTSNSVEFFPFIDIDGMTCDKAKDKQLEAIVDGCCDTIYVATGILASCGVPDLPHLAEVCRANDSKFPNGTATIDPDSGKYLKPEGWQGPNHHAVMQTYCLDDGIIEIGIPEKGEG